MTEGEVISGVMIFLIGMLIGVILAEYKNKLAKK